MSTCRALVPVMDTQVLTIVRQIDQRCKEFIHRQAMDSIKATTALISIDGALTILDAFNYGNDTFYLKGLKWQARDLGVENYFPDLQGRMANETPVIWFWGGPPTALKWYRGTLQTLLDDRVLYEVNHKGAVEIAKLIGMDI
jgi:hypothetical protein